MYAPKLLLPIICSDLMLDLGGVGGALLKTLVLYAVAEKIRCCYVC